MDPAEGVSTVGLPLYQKETKRQFLQYVHDLEASISQYKTKLSELQRDHEILHESYMHELNNNGKSEHAINVIKRIINKLVGNGRGISNAASPGEIGEGDENDQQQEGLLCSLCCDLKEIQALEKLMKQNVFDKKRHSQTKNLKMNQAIELSALNAIGEVKETDVETLDRDIERLNKSLELTDKLSEIDVAEFLMDDFAAIAEVKKSATQKLNLKGLFGTNDEPRSRV